MKILCLRQCADAFVTKYGHESRANVPNYNFQMDQRLTTTNIVGSSEPQGK